jgi:uncharacterized membrane protein (UPF0136 family)
MSSVDCPAASAQSGRTTPAALKRAVTSPRFLVYSSCTLLALVTAYSMGKEMQWDTLDYHLYAGFSAIHGRFGLDYFAAGPQSYLNPYAYVPFYLLVSSGLTALGAAAILAVLQAPVLWLTYELAIALAPPDSRRVRVAIGAAAVLLAFANPVLIQQFGSSFADITTAELALAGGLLIIGAIRAPSHRRMVAAGFLLGAASALKLTNSLDALSFAIATFFVPVTWSKRLRFGCLYGLSVGLAFVLVSAPWSLQLERQFGNPFFPLFNGIFRAPEYTTAPVIDSRFIPPSLAAAVWRPFAMLAPVRMVHLETPAPDPRYALLLVLGVLLVIAHLWRRSRKGWMPTPEARASDEARMLPALACAFLINWAMWLSTSGNSRYFIPMACVAAVLIVTFAHRLLAAHQPVRTYAIAAILGVVQIYQVQAGTAFRTPLPWEGRAWFDVSVPQPLASQPSLYFSVGIQSNSFIVPYLAPGSGFVNIDGMYVLGPDGANGARIRELIRRFSPHLRVLTTDTRVDADEDADVPHLDDVEDAVEPFGLRVDTGRCVRIVAQFAPKLQIVTVARQLPGLPLPKWYTRYMVSCQLVQDRTREDALVFKESAPNLALDRLEDACPELFQPRRPMTFVLGEAVHRYTWARQYSNTNILAWVHDGRVKFQRLIGRHRELDVGSEFAWERAPPPLACGRFHSN